MKKETLIKLACLIATDGGIYRKRNQIYFDSVDEKLIMTFCELARKIGIKKIRVNKGHGTRVAYFYSKKIAEKLSEILNHSKEIPLQHILRLPKENIVEILRILFSTDGGVSLSQSKCKKDGKGRFHRKVTFTSANKQNLFAVKKLLECFDISSNIVGNDLEIKGKENLEKFKVIGFLEGVKVTRKSKKWCGIEKNELLRICLESYRYTYGE